MRRALSLLVLLSLAFAPAPLPRPDRQPQQRARLECETQLAALGVTWELEHRDGQAHVLFVVHKTQLGALEFARPLVDGDLLAALQGGAKTAAAIENLRPAKGVR